MPQDIVKAKGPLKSNNPGVGGGVTNNFPVYGIVKDNIDPTRSGRIKVLIGDKSPQDSDSSDSWLTVGFMSNFFGTIVGSGGKDDNGTYKSNPSSYGEWHAPPDIGTKVICIFVNGDPNYGYYIGCVPEPEALHMVPAIGSSDNVQLNEGESTSYGGATRLPVTNFNSNNTGLNDSGSFNDSPRPVHSYTASIMNQQGIIRDPIRGPISSSASRETASRVGWGVSTPGRPIYEGGYDDQTVVNNLDKDKAKQLQVVARRGGHSFVMDDGDIIGRDQLVRIRTALGHQILMSDDGQTLMILHSNGQSYIELGKEGTVDIFSTNSFNVRTQGDINFHADRNINLHAMENLNIQAKNIQTNSEEKTKIRSGGDINMSATGKITGLAAGAIAWGAGGDASLVGGGQAFVNGTKVNLNSGAPGTSPEAVSPIPLVAQTDTLYDPEKGFMAAPGKLLTIASRAPAHAPWANAGQGVDVKTSMDAAANLPAPAAAATEAANQAAQATNPQPPATATVASAPSATPPVSAAIDKNTTAAAVAQSATAAAAGPLSAATKQGSAIVESAQGKVAAVGAMAQTPAQLELGGALKPGAATIVNTLVQAGKSLEQALPKSLFSGSVPGASSLTSLVTNVAAQATTVVNTMQKAQSALGAVGALTGKESPTQIAGMVTAAASVGVGPVVDVVKTAAAAASSPNVPITPPGGVGVAGTIVAGPSVNNLGSAIASGAVTNTTGATLAAKAAALPGSGTVTDVTGASLVAKAAALPGSGTVTNLTGSKSSLTGSLSGAASGAVNSVVSSAAGQVTGAINKAVPNVAGKANAALGQANAALGKATGALDKTKSALKAIGAGGAAAQLSEAVGGLGGIQSALTAMGNVPSLTSLVDKAAGVSTSAFNAVKKSFKSFKPNIPQNLTQIAKDNAAEAAAVADQAGQAGTNLLNAAGANTPLATVTDPLAGLGGVAGVGKSVVKTPLSLGQAIKTVSTVAGAIGSVSGAIGKVSSLAGASGGLGGAVGSINNSISSISGELTNAKSALSKVSGLATAATTTLNNVTAIVNTVKKSPTGSVLNTTIGGIENAVNNVSAMAGAGATITAGGLPALSNAASVVQQGAQAATSSAMASGLSNLPGGINTVASVTNNATGATNVVPGTAYIKTAITNATTAVMNGLPSAASAAGALSSVAGALGNNKLAGTLSKVSGAIGTLNKLGGAADALKKGLPDLKGATSALGGAVGDIQGKLNGLTALASLGLPVGAIAELQSAISSLAGGTPGAIGLPAIGFNTTDRGAVTAQIGAVLGDPGIPAPNLVGEIPQETKSALDDKIAELKKKKAEINVKRKDLKEKRDAALKEYRKAEKSLPKGDPAIMAAYTKYSDAFDEWQKVDLEYDRADLELETQRLNKLSPGAGDAARANADATINSIIAANGG
jgi:hypothetical protein